MQTIGYGIVVGVLLAPFLPLLTAEGRRRFLAAYRRRDE